MFSATEDGIPVSPLDNNTRMDDIDLENISDDSGEVKSEGTYITQLLR